MAWKAGRVRHKPGKCLSIPGLEPREHLLAIKDYAYEKMQIAEHDVGDGDSKLVAKGSGSWPQMSLQECWWPQILLQQPPCQEDTIYQAPQQPQQEPMASMEQGLEAALCQPQLSLQGSHQGIWHQAGEQPEQSQKAWIETCGSKRCRPTEGSETQMSFITGTAAGRRPSAAMAAEAGIA